MCRLRQNKLKRKMKIPIALMLALEYIAHVIKSRGRLGAVEASPLALANQNKSMATIPNIGQLNELDDGVVVQAAKGKIESVFERKSGGSGDKSWTVQAFTLNDNTGKIRVSCWNRDPLQIQKGQEIFLYASKASTGKWGGLFVKDNTYNGKTTKELALQKSGVMALSGKTEGANVSKSAESGDKPMTPKLYLFKCALLMVESYKAARYVSSCLEKDNGLGLTQEQIQSVGASMFIAASRRNAELEMTVPKMPRLEPTMPVELPEVPGQEDDIPPAIEEPQAEPEVPEESPDEPSPW